MANVIPSPIMGLPIPVVGVDPGPDFAFNVNAALTLIDSHDHTPGKGSAITPAAMNINTALTFVNNPATNVAYLNLAVQSSVTALTSVYVKGAELFFRDGNNNEVQITLNGGVDGTPGSITGLPSGTAGVNYNSSLFTFSQATNTPANIAVGSVLLGNNTALSKYLTLAPPTAMAANTTITLPTLPSSATSIMQMDTSGNITAQLAVDNTTLQNSGTVLSVKNSGINTSQLADASVTSAKLAIGAIGTTNIANNAVTPAKMAAYNYNSSLSSGSFSTISTSFVAVTNLSISLTCSGVRPILVVLSPYLTASLGYIEYQDIGNGFANGGEVQILLDGTAQYTASVGAGNPGASASPIYHHTGSLSFFLAAPSAGSHTFSVKVKVGDAGDTIVVNNMQLYIYEL